MNIVNSTVLKIVVFYFFSHFLFAQSKLLTINESNQSSHPRYGVDVNGTLYFTAGTANQSNVRVWKTDGTNAGTTQTFTPNATIPAGPIPHFSKIDAVTQFGNKVLIIASVSQQNFDHELWVSDGTPAGTFRLADINPGSGDPSISSLTVTNIGGQSIAFFSANDGTNGSELWKTDGTSAGTQMVKNINSGSFSSSPTGFTQLTNKVLFFANNGINGTEPWVTDGTSAGTFILKDINTGLNSSFYSFGTKPVSLSSNGYFEAYNTSNIPALWTTDGTELGTVAVQGGSYQYPKNLTVFQNKVYFTMNQTFTNLLYIDNPALPPTFVYYYTGGFNVLNAKDFTVSGGKLFFTSTTADNECRLYQISDNPNLAYSCKDINPSDTGDPFPTNSIKRKFYPVGNGNIVFLAKDQNNGTELWFSDGTINGTVLIKDHALGTTSGDYSYIKILGDLIFYVVNDADGKYDAWMTSVNAFSFVSTNSKMSTINPGLNLSNFYPIATSSGQLYFSAYDKTIGYELYKTNGNSMSLVKDIATAYNADNTQSFNITARVGSTLYFAADNGKNGLEVWKTNGDTTNTKLAFEINKYPTLENNSGYTTNYDFYNTSTEISKLFSDGTKLYIAESYYLWVYDGLNAPTKVYNVTNTRFDYLAKFVVMNGLIYFSNGNRIYKTDGTAAGTAFVTSPDGTNTYDYRYISDLVALDNKIYFKGYHPTHGEEIFSSDGTTGNVTLLDDLIPGNNAFTYLAAEFNIVGSDLYFLHYNSSEGCTLYKTNGAAANTTKLKVFDINGGCPSYLTNYKNQFLAFQAYDETNGYELWKSNGTVLGTEIVKDINPTGSSSPMNLANNFKFAFYNDFLYFYANDGVNSFLYKTNLSSPGTEKIVKANSFLILGTNHGVYFNRYEPALGSEPYKIESDSASMRLVSDVVFGTAGSNYSVILQHGDNLFLRTSSIQSKYEIHVFKICPNEFVLKSPQIANNTYEALDLIKMSSGIGNGISNQLLAGKNIELLPGFSTATNTKFSAKIGGCKANIYGNAP